MGLELMFASVFKR